MLAAIRTLHRLECVLEAMHAALNQLSQAAPTWVQQRASLEWYDRYGLRSDQVRLPKEASKREALPAKLGGTAITFWTACGTPRARPTSVTSPLWRRCRSGCNSITVVPSQGSQPSVGAPRTSNRAAALRITSPYDLEARYCTKRDTQWVGYKHHPHRDL